ncbi:hypothetical protein VE01_04595 [Pseudogymnoascus verrucosus]|uniref:Zn(2)-C6 fungal-type domain-containing protein n=1 Tax=Pseudogymnoascus verrucosus TaxID=342668 RepID=A0A1B8GPA2_9PEZI|nr:uncharacterized protein VE01_04595 [Pseudogymnoascus verrucosus]OBT97675.2 hypothetical protein VE01_04595 [Pseudogymnoascus verrucosus]
MNSNIVNHQQPYEANWAKLIEIDRHNFGSLAPITQSDYPDSTTRPAIELGPPRQKRRLEYVKCDFCRRSKKKCEPSERQWPGEKCQRCDAKGFTCSAPVKKNRAGSDALAVDNISLLASNAQNLLHEERAYCALAEKCIQQISSGLQRNICKLSLENTKIGAIHRSHINHMVPEELRYACRYWVPHLCRGKYKFLGDVDLQNQVYNFLTGHFLCWLEALSLLGHLQDGINSLESLVSLVDNAICSAKLRGFVLDAKRFILDYRADIEQFPLSIYPSALQCVQSGSMKEIHIPELPVSGDLHRGKIWGSRMTTLRGHTSRVFDIAFSPDGKLLATASLDGTVRLCDVATQKTLQVLEHNRGVGAMAFSPDGNLLACAVRVGDARDRTVKLWNPATGKELQMQSPMESGDFVNCIAFSPDGKLLASASDEKKIRIWDPTTGCLLLILIHKRGAQSVAFSPDGRLLASACGGGVIKLWDPHTGYEIRSFVAHSVCIFAIAFSPDGQLLASTSLDTTVKIWDLATGINRQTFAEHTRSVVSIAFSPDGKLLLSASLDKTIQIWESTTGNVHDTLVRPGEIDSGIALSPDGSLLACAFSGTGAVDMLELHGFK